MATENLRMAASSMLLQWEIEMLSNPNIFNKLSIPDKNKSNVYIYILLL